MGTSFSLTISVTDGMHTLPGVLTVDINLAHDPPVIDNLPATHFVREDLTVPSVIFHVNKLKQLHRKLLIVSDILKQVLHSGNAKCTSFVHDWK
jgi:cephalosporin hydroxylase